MNLVPPLARPSTSCLRLLVLTTFVLGALPLAATAGIGDWFQSIGGGVRRKLNALATSGAGLLGTEDTTWRPTVDQVSEDFDPARDLPPFGNFRRKDSRRLGGNGFGMAFRTQAHLFASRYDWSAGSPFLSAGRTLADHEAGDLLRAFQADTRAYRSESVATPGSSSQVATSLLRSIQTASERGQVLSLSCAENRLRRYLFVYRGSRFKAYVAGEGGREYLARAFDFYDPHVRWDGRGEAPRTRTGTLLALQPMDEGPDAPVSYWVDDAWNVASADNSGKGTHLYAERGGTAKVKAVWDGGTIATLRDFSGLHVTGIGTATSDVRTVDAGYNWEKLAEAEAASISGVRERLAAAASDHLNQKTDSKFDPSTDVEYGTFDRSFGGLKER